MKRFHVHLHVEELAKSIGFYSTLFAAEPTRREADYAKWMLEDPPLNFAISSRGGKVGIDHLGIQAGNAEELAELKGRAAQADSALADEGVTNCCYSRSEKHWITDPQGVAWEQFQTLANIAQFSGGTAEAPERAGACCPQREAGAQASGKPVGVPARAAGACC